MKKVFIAMAAIAAMASSCTKEEITSGELPVQEGKVRISLVDETTTRATGEDHGDQTDDNNINTLEVFIFKINKGGVNDGMLDGYKKYTADDLKNLSELELSTTTGKKVIYVVANSQKEDWSEGLDRTNFEKQMAYLYKEDAKNFVMFAGKEVSVQLETSVSMTLVRMVSRIALNSLTVSFSGTLYEGAPLENVKAYLTNVQAQKYLLDGSGTNLKVVNSRKYIPEDMEGAKMEGLLFDQLATRLYDETHSTPHYFYCYENAIGQENETDRFTKLVIEGTLNGITYYYPVPIKELRRNSCYSVDVKIYRPGSLDPEVGVEVGTMDLKLNILPWNIVPGSVVEF